MASIPALLYAFITIIVNFYPFFIIFITASTPILAFYLLHLRIRLKQLKVKDTNLSIEEKRLSIELKKIELAEKES